MLSGHAQADMGVWASWSVLRFLPEARLCVHSDGTLTEADRARWARVVPGARFVSRAEADALCAARLRPRFALLRRWRDAHLLALKLVDGHLLAEADHVLVMDTDVLCFQPPTLVEQCVAGRDGSVWMTDMHWSYLALPRVLHEALGMTVAPQVNSGFWLAPRAGEADWAMMSWALHCLRNDGRCDWAHAWAEQTMTGIWLSMRDGGRPLPRTYAVVPGRTPREQVVHHYVGTRTVRPRFFTEGVCRLRRQLREQGASFVEASEEAVM